MGLLKNTFEACRKVFKPTPEERAEQQLNDNIRKRSTDLDLAVRGKRVGEYTEDQRSAATYSYGMYGMAHVPPPIFDLNETQQEFHIEQATQDLLDLGVSQEKIDGIIAHAQDCMDNPKPTWFGYLER